MSIYEELIEGVSEGKSFYIDFGKRNMRIGRKYLIKDGEFDQSKELMPQIYKDACNLESILHIIEQLYKKFKYSLPSERSDNKRKNHFKALPMEELTDEQLIVAERREVACAALEGFVLCTAINGQLVWDEQAMQGKWFWQSKTEPDLILLRSWFESK